MTNTIISVGREVNGKYDIKVPESFNKVSRNHAKIEYLNNQFVFLDNSQNGSYVNNTQVKRSIIEKDEEVKLGSPFSDGFSLSWNMVNDKFQSYLKENKKEFIVEFDALKPVYEAYRKETIIIKNNFKKKAMVPRVLLTLGAILILAFIPIPNEIRISLMSIAGIIGGFITISSSSEEKLNNEIENLLIKHSKNYKCPKCDKKFTLNVPTHSWGILKENKTCPHGCGAIFNK